MNNANDLISRQALCEYALNQKDKSITPNDIMRFPSADIQIVKQIIHEAIDNTPMAEDIYVGIKEKLHKAVEEA